MTDVKAGGAQAVSEAGLVVREAEYGDKLAAVEPGGAEYIPLDQRHGTPLKLFWTWTSPNLEFATVFLGVLAVAAFGLNFWQAVAAAALGSALGALSHAVLSARAPKHGVGQMVLGRVPFGFRGNALPAGLNTIAGGIGWFAVNSVSAALALSTLTGLPKALCLFAVVVIQVTVGFFGHNFVHTVERYAFPVLAVVFVLASIVILSKANFGAPASGEGGGLGGFLIATAAAFGYAAGWNPYAADLTRYLAPDTPRLPVALFAGLGIFVGCTGLQIVGAAAVTIGGDALGDPTGTFTGHMPTLIGDLTLLAVTLGAICANAINVYSGSMSFVTIGVKLPMALQRAMVALVFGVLGLVVAYFGLDDAGHDYEAFLLIIAYWIGPWLGVIFMDMWLRRGQPIDGLLYDTTHRNLAGPIAMAVGIVVSVALFCNQELYVAPVPKNVPEVGDITFAVGFVLAALVYAALRRLPGRTSAAPQES
ncbi:purine-cytosine permease family protein [Actinomadura sp. SCN-SB]|uniref:purine-cytosine permease family protein n=1 Tax=Actinomadura sp. SCN-SB TaxID=3373092 RepID=UPI0037527A82